MKVKIVYFDAKDKISLAAALFAPKRSSGKAILYLHGLGGNFYTPTAMSIAKSACNEGIALLSIQQRGSYIAEEFSFGETGKRILAGAAFEKFEDSAHDIYGALSFLKKMGFKEVIIIGKSTGCQKAIYFLYKNRKKRITKIIKGLILLSPVDDRSYDIWNYKRHKKDFYRSLRIAKVLKRKDPYAIMPKEIMPKGQWPISASRFLSTADEKSIEGRILDYKGSMREFKSINIPIAAIFGTKDEYMVIPIRKAAERLKENRNLVSVTLIKGAGHSLYTGNRFPSKMVIKLVRELLEMKL
ncbi:MAG: DUF1749 domain-containing protein [Candidatus Micrarchaeaceae archaeon]